MRKSILSLAFLCFTALTFAQDGGFIEKAKLNAALTLGSYSFNSDTQSQDVEYGLGAGFRLGIDYDIIQKEKFSIETGLTFHNHRSVVDEPEINYSLYWVGTHAMGNFIVPEYFSVGLGFWADYGVAGTQQFGDGEKVKVFKKQPGAEDTPINPFNYGAVARVSYVLSWTDFADDIYVSYRYGIGDIEGTDAPTQTFKTRMISIGVRSTFDNLF